MKDLLDRQPVSRTALWLASGLLGFSVVPHFWNLPPAIPLAFLALVATRLLLWPRPDRIAGLWLRIPLVLAGLLLVGQQVGFQEGRRFGVALLVVMAGLKVMEVKTRRDLLMAVFLGYFLLITLFLFSRSAQVTAWVLLLTLGYTALLALLSRPYDRQGPGPALRLAGRMALGAVPVMVLLFVLFPRLDQPLWRLELGGPRGITGLSETLRMGSIARLSQSDAVAFRVRFQGPPPPPGERYWRAMVLWRTDGRRWQRVAAPLIRTPRPPPARGARRYRVTLEATRQRWLPLLDRGIRASGDAVLDRDGQLTARTRITRRFTYSAVSVTPPLGEPLGRREHILGLQLPRRISPRVRALARSWREQSTDDADLVRKALQYFHDRPFIYTLQPPLLEGDPVEQFLFETRQGFCEHYAASFVLLMRLAGLPARVVTGYLGGERNPLGGHLVVRQADAHAWAEVWLRGRGWVRVDPTAAVAPERVQRGVAPQPAGVGTPARFRVEVPAGWVARVTRQLGWLGDDLQLLWHEWVVGFDARHQERLLHHFGLGDLGRSRLAVLAVLGGLALAALLFLLTARPGRRVRDPAAEAWQRFRRKLRRAGLDLPPSTGPLDTGQAAMRHFPAAAGAIHRIVHRYIQLRYGHGGPPHQLQRLRREIRRLRLR